MPGAGVTNEIVERAGASPLPPDSSLCSVQILFLLWERPHAPLSNQNYWKLQPPCSQKPGQDFWFFQLGIMRAGGAGTALASCRQTARSAQGWPRSHSGSDS